MPLLLIPLSLLALLVLVVVLMPVGIVQRYRFGKARRRARPWVVRTNAWVLVASTALFALGAWVSHHWIAHALGFAAFGLLSGALIGIVGAWTTHFERHPDGFYYTPNRWLVLALTLLVAARIALGLWQVWRSPGVADDSVAMALLTDHGNLFAFGGVLLGYALASAWCLRARMPSAASARPSVTRD